VSHVDNYTSIPLNMKVNMGLFQLEIKILSI